MASTYTANLKLELIPTGAQSGIWGATTNVNLGSSSATQSGIEQAIVGKATLPTGDFVANVATYTMADTNASQTARAFVLDITATLTGAGTVNLPSIQKPYLIFNNSVGGYAVTVKVTGLTGISIPNGKKAYVYTNSSGDVTAAFDYAPSLSLGTALTTTSGGTGVSSYTAGDLPYYASGTALSKLPIGTSTYVLTSSGTAPQWTAPSAIPVGTATNLAGGTTGATPYQTSAGATSFLSLGTTNYVMTAGASAPQYVAQSTLSVGTATNLAGGAAYRIAYQTGSGTTSFITAPTTTGYVLGWTGSALDWVAAPAATTTSNISGGSAGVVPYQSGVGTTSFTSVGTTGYSLISQGTSAPVWDLVSLSNGVTNVLPINNGGTNTTATPTAGGVSYGTGTEYAFTAAGTAGQALVSGGAAAPVFGTLGISGGGTNSTATPTAGGVGYGTGTAHAYTTAGAAGGVLYSTGSGAPVFTAAGTAGQALISNGASPPTWGTAGITTGKSIAMAMIFGF